VREMDKIKLIAILTRLLGGKEKLDFLVKLDEADLKKLVMLTREKIGTKSS
jgi:hypothetical protein